MSSVRSHRGERAISVNNARRRVGLGGNRSFEAAGL